MPLADILAVSSLIIALVALAVSWYNLRTADRAARNDIVAELRGWADQVIDLLSESSELCGGDSSTGNPLYQATQRSRLSTRASALLDRGRFFFPNIHQDAFGAHKPSAYRGLRSPILDVLLLSFELLRNIDPESGRADDPRRRAFIHLKRAFVSAIQAAISPSAPATAKDYEAFLPTVRVEALPEQIRTLAGAVDRSFELQFKSDIRLDAGYQA